MEICQSNCGDERSMYQAERAGGRLRNTSSNECPGDMLVDTITGLQISNTHRVQIACVIRPSVFTSKMSASTTAYKRSGLRMLFISI